MVIINEELLESIWKDKNLYEVYKDELSCSYEEWCEFVDQYGYAYIQHAMDIVNFCNEYKQTMIEVLQNANKIMEDKNE